MLTKVRSFFSRVWQGLTKAKNRVCEFLKFDIWTPECWFETKSTGAPEMEPEESPTVKTQPTEDDFQQKIQEYLAPMPWKLFVWDKNIWESQNIGIYHLNHPVTERCTLTFGGLVEQFDRQPQFVKQLFQIPGVRKVTIEPYKVAIELGKVFTWDNDMHIAVIEVFYENLTDNKRDIPNHND